MDLGASLVEDNVAVTSVEGTKEFYVLLPGLSKTTAECHQKIQLQAENESEPAVIVLHDTYLAKCHDGSWYRVQVRQILVRNKEATEEARVFFLDLGKYGIVNKSLMKTCCSDICKNKRNAEKCSLIMTPMKLHEQDTDEMVAVFKNLVSGRKRFKLIIWEIIEADDTYLVDLITTDRIQNFSVADFLLSINNFYITPRVLIQMKTIKTLKISNGSSIKVRRVESPSELYVSVVDMNQDEEVMNMEMSSFYKQNPVNLTLLMPGVKCATEKPPETWQRVEVLSSPDCDGWCKVRYIDKGKVDFLKWQELFELDEQFYNFPSFCLRCSLGGIKAIGTFWSDDSTEFLRNNFMHHECEAKFFGPPDNTKLFVVNKKTKINVNQSLIFFGYARSTDEIKEPEKVYESLDTPHPSETLSGKLHAVEIIDLDNFDPLRFCVKYLEFSGARKAIMEHIQNSEICNGVIWRVSHLCIVFCSIDKERQQWHRGVITEIKSDTVQVVLCEYGIKVQTSIENLRECPAAFKRIKFTTALAKLHCSVKGAWTKERKEIGQSIINSYDHFYVQFKDDNAVQFSLNSNPRPVILWGQLSQGVKLNIVRQLEEIGVVESVHKHGGFTDPEEMQDSPLHLLPISIKENIVAEQKALTKTTDLTVQIKEFNVVLKRQFIDKWLPPLHTTKLNFVGIPTNIDRKGNIVLHEWKHHAVLAEVSKVINKVFQEIEPTIHPFKVGEPCMVRFEDDNLFYRGEVNDLDVNGNTCSVEFIDYGNIQKRTNMKDLFREVICTEIPPLAQRYRLEGSPAGTSGEIDQDMLDKLHITVVDQNIEINVIPKDSVKSIPNYVKRCWITVDQKVIKSYGDFLLNIDQFIKAYST